MESSENTAATPEPAPPPMSLSARLLNVIVAPSEAFDSIRGAPPAVGNWLVPILLGCLMGLIHVWVMFSQPAVQQQMREAQAKQFEQMVEQGRMSAEQADQIQNRFGDRQFLIMKIAGSASAVVMSFVYVFLLAGLMWLICRTALRAPLDYMKGVEVTALAGLVGVVGGVATLCLVVMTGNMLANPGPMLLLSDFDPANKQHAFLASLNVVTLWYLAVLAIGVSRLTGRSFARVAVWPFGIWLLIRLGVVFSGLGAQGM